MMDFKIIVLDSGFRAYRKIQLNCFENATSCINKVSILDLLYLEN